MLGIGELNLLNKKALVVGGTRGIGLSIAKAYHQLNAEVVICGRSESGFFLYKSHHSWGYTHLFW